MSSDRAAMRRALLDALGQLLLGLPGGPMA